MSDVAVKTERLGKRYRISTRPAATTLAESGKLAARRAASRILGRPRLRKQELWALRELSIEVERGEILGVVGRNGAGKSTFLKLLTRITEPTEGYAEIRGRVGSLLEVGTGFHQELTGRDNVYLNGAILGMRRREIAQKFDEIVEFAGVERFIDVPVKRYSSGMQVRLAFAVAAFLEPEILLVDEVLSVGDQAFQQRCLGRMQEVTQAGRTVVFVSHNLAAVSSLCTRALLLKGGRLVEDGGVSDVIERYLASIEQSTQRSLRDRPDRRGVGRLRFTDVSVTGPAGAVLSGDPVEILLDYEADASPPGLVVGVSVSGPWGEPLFLCSNRYTGEGLADLPAAGRLRCFLPRLPLHAGRYSLNVYAEGGGETLDWIEHAAMFEILESDFFGTGRLPPAAHGPLLLDQAWSVAAADRTTA